MRFFEALIVASFSTAAVAAPSAHADRIKKLKQEIAAEDVKKLDLPVLNGKGSVYPETPAAADKIIRGCLKKNRPAEQGACLLSLDDTSFGPDGKHEPACTAVVKKQCAHVSEPRILARCVEREAIFEDTGCGWFFRLKSHAGNDDVQYDGKGAKTPDAAALARARKAAYAPEGELANAQAAEKKLCVGVGTDCRDLAKGDDLTKLRECVAKESACTGARYRVKQLSSPFATLYLLGCVDDGGLNGQTLTCRSNSAVRDEDLKRARGLLAKYRAVSLGKTKELDPLLHINQLPNLEEVITSDIEVNRLSPELTKLSSVHLLFTEPKAILDLSNLGRFKKLKNLTVMALGAGMKALKGLDSVTSPEYVTISIMRQPELPNLGPSRKIENLYLTARDATSLGSALAKAQAKQVSVSLDWNDDAKIELGDIESLQLRGEFYARGVDALVAAGERLKSVTFETGEKFLDLARLVGFKSVERIGISGDVVTCKGKAEWASLKSLNLDAEMDPAILRCLKKAPKLESISGYGPKWKDADLIALTRMPSLKTASIQGATFSEAALKKVRGTRADLRVSQ